MLSTFKYSHLSTKVRAMKGKMLKKDDYEQLLLRRSVGEVALYLKNYTYYNDALQGLHDGNIHRGQVENLLAQSKIKEALKISRYLKGTDKSVFRYIYRRQEIEDLKKMLRTLQMGGNLEQIDKSLFFINKYSVINFDKLLQAKNIESFVNGLEGTNFYPILKPLVIDKQRIDLFAAEMTLDMYYYKKLLTQLELVSGTDKKIATHIVGLEADLKNIMWVYRGKHYYHISKEILYRYHIPFRYKLSKEDLKKLINANDVDDILQILKKTSYNDILSSDEHYWEKEFYEYILDTHDKNIGMYPFSIAPIMGFMFAKEVEIMNITTIIEGIRYAVEQSKIKKFLIGYGK
ncbi:V-type ATPase subunit [Vallitalea pronyensis]|uniref:V-type ATPase subunit n=1 Tax=Vallitalea pronyensis TaxID=1348613 RepID=A0A8J8MN50_9FIRM|nr:V-type ATPase subunit [Vallitalea pronyensis]QUI24750.1 V-type ATPase subunit [Vallitalea pronyensis]